MVLPCWNRAGRTELKDVEDRFQQALLSLPNPPDPSTPVGTSDPDNVEVRRWGEPPAFPFPPRDHMELGRLLGIIETELAVKVAGSRAYFLKNEGVAGVGRSSLRYRSVA